MMRKVRIEDAGDTSLLSGSTVDLAEVREENARIARLNRERGNCRRASCPMPRRSIRGC
jgi:DNA-directed RNA polymerase subunit beta'